MFRDVGGISHWSPERVRVPKTRGTSTRGTLKISKKGLIDHVLGKGAPRLKSYMVPGKDKVILEKGPTPKTKPHLKIGEGHSVTD